MATLYGPDSFTAADGTSALTRPPWSVNSGTWVVASNRMAQTDGFGARLIRYNDTISGDQWIELDIIAVDTSQQITLRYANTNNDPGTDGAPHVIINGDGSGILLGNTAWLGTFGAAAFPYTLRFEAEGEALRIYRNGSLIHSGTDSGTSRLTGQPAISEQPDGSPSSLWDNVSVGDFSAGSDDRTTTGTVTLTLASSGTSAKAGVAGGGVSLGLATGGGDTKAGAATGAVALATAVTATDLKAGVTIGATSLELGVTGSTSGELERTTVGTVGLALAASGATNKQVSTVGALALQLNAVGFAGNLAPVITGLRSTGTVDRIRSTDTISLRRTTVAVDQERVTS